MPAPFLLPSREKVDAKRTDEGAVRIFRRSQERDAQPSYPFSPSTRSKITRFVARSWS